MKGRDKLDSKTCEHDISINYTVEYEGHYVEKTVAAYQRFVCRKCGEEWICDTVPDKAAIEEDLRKMNRLKGAKKSDF